MPKKQQQKCILVDWEKFCLSPKRFIQAQNEKLYRLWNGNEGNWLYSNFLKRFLSKSIWVAKRTTHFLFKNNKKRGGGSLPVSCLLKTGLCTDSLFLLCVQLHDIKFIILMTAWVMHFYDNLYIFLFAFPNK